MKVSIVECNSYKQREVDRAVESALDEISYKFQKNLNVLIKPNLLSSYEPEKAITTHPSVVEAVCKILKRNDCKITIAESTGFFTQEKHLLFSKTGMEDVAKRYGAELLLLEKLPSKEYEEKYKRRHGW